MKLGVTTFFAGHEHAPTVDGLREQFGCDGETACELMELAETGYHLGRNGFRLEDCDTALLREKILVLEMSLEVEYDSVHDIFVQAMAAGREEYEAGLN